MARWIQKVSLEVRKFKPGFEALGLITDFLASDKPFANFSANKLLTAIKYQLSHGQHIAGFEDDRLVAYCGWLSTTKSHAEAWMKGRGRLDFIATGEAVALTVVKILKPDHVLPMIRACRDRNQGKRFYFKREYATGILRPRKATVLNKT